MTISRVYIFIANFGNVELIVECSDAKGAQNFRLANRRRKQDAFSFYDRDVEQSEG